MRYVRNITDVGHLEHDADEGEDKIAKKARLEQLEPMEVVQHYLTRYHKAMEALNVLPPFIEPHASGHIIEQIEYVKKILDAGYAYVSDGSVYFDVPKFNAEHGYGKPLGTQHRRAALHHPRARRTEREAQPRRLRPLEKGRARAHHALALALERRIPRLAPRVLDHEREISRRDFDIHGGGMDLKFPHHECEIAQCVAHNGPTPCATGCTTT